VLDPTFAKKYTQTTLGNNSLIFESAKRTKAVSNMEIYVMDIYSYQMTGQQSYTFAGESKITNAIDYVTTESLPTIYTLTGHGETALSSELISAIQDDNFSIKDLSLFGGDTVPEDMGCLLINDPTSDISENELQKMLDYMDKGGNILLNTGYQETEMANLGKLEENFGVKKLTGVVFEGDANKYLHIPHYLLPNIIPHPANQAIIHNKLPVFMPISHAIEKLPNVRSSLTVRDLLTTSDSAYEKPVLTAQSVVDREEGDISGPFTLAVAVEEDVQDASSKFVWFASSQYVTDNANDTVSGANSDMLLGVLGWMCDRPSSISIHTKSLTDEKLVIPASTSYALSILIIILLPLAALVVGGIIAYRRRAR
jgi:ABC-2 type transport system permease protein